MLVYSGESRSNQQRVIFKHLIAKYITIDEAALFGNQYQLLKDIKFTKVVRIIDFYPDHQDYVLVLEDFGDCSLDLYFEDRNLLKLSHDDIHNFIDIFLRIAIQIIEGLEEIHQERIIHKDIKPANIQIDRQTGQIKLTNFGFAISTNEIGAQVPPTDRLEGTLAYMAPEQTGRINRLLDYRCDLYAVGVTFYELLTGKLPFTTSDPLSLIHAHLTKPAISIDLINSNIPKVLAIIIDRLISKRVEDRYQNTSDLRLDLEQCLSKLNLGKIEDFALRSGTITQNEVDQLILILAKDSRTEYQQKSLAIASKSTELLERVLAIISAVDEDNWTEVELTTVERRRLFDIVYRLDREIVISANVLTQNTARYKLPIRLNQFASHQAKQQRNYLLAIEYARFGLKLLGHDGWKREYAIALQSYELAISVALRCGEFELVDAWSDLTISQIESALERVEIDVTRIQSLIERDRPLAAIELARAILVPFGIELSPSPTEQDVEAAIQEIDSLLDRMVELPAMNDRTQLAIARIATAMMGAGYATDLHLYAIVVALSVKLSLQYGQHSSSADSYARYALVIDRYHPDPIATERFSNLARELVLSATTTPAHAKTLATIGLFLTARTRHLSNAIGLFQTGYQAGLAAGKLGDASYNRDGWLSAAFWCGENLAQLATLATELNQRATGTAMLRYRAIVDAIRLLSDERVDEIDPDLCPASPALEQFSVYFYRAVGEYILGDRDLTTIGAAREQASAIAGSFEEASYWFYDSLIALANAQGLDESTLHRISANQSQLAARANSAPMNYLHKWQLVVAEVYRCLDDKSSAIEFYDLAIAGAIAHNYPQEAALANELAAKFYLTWGKPKIATDYLSTAIAGYQQWGATAKVRALTTSYAHLLDATASASLVKIDPLQCQIIPNSLDFTTYTRSIEALYSESDLDGLLRTLMDLVVAHAGADKAALLLNRDDNLTIALEYDAGEVETMDFDLHSFDREYRLPLYLLRDVHHTQAITIYDRDDNPYLTTDPYFERDRPQSVLCIPICIQTQAIGMLYLENSSIEQAFSRDRIELLNIICTQAAISIENARLQQESQEYARQLESSLNSLRSSQARLAKIADNIPGAIAQICVDLDRNTCALTYISSGCYQLYEMTATELLASRANISQFDHPEDRDRIAREIVEARHQNLPIELEYRIITPSGKVKWIYLAASERQPQADGTFLVECTILDISQRHQAQQQLQITNEELLRSNRLKDQFLANMSHELRTPLNAILGMAEGLQERVFGEISDRQSAAITTISTSGMQLLSLINDVLELAKIEAGTLEIDRSPTEIVALCQSCLVFIKQQAFRKRLQVEVRIQSQLPMLLVDARHIRQVVVNLLTNAVKFTPAGGQIGLEVSYLDTPDFQSTIDDDLDSPAFCAQVGLAKRVRIAVTDTGIGIAPDNLQQLFQPFIQIDGALNRQFEGTGLGLALVKRIVDLHDGIVTINSELGIGSCFTVDLPCPKTPLVYQSGDREPAQSDTPLLDFTTARTPVILLAEDNQANVHTMSSYLRAKGFEVVIVPNGCEAIEQTKAILPDAILMDIQMPTMDGLTAISAIRQFSDVPIIALTALTMTSEQLDETLGDCDRCLTAGANEYLTKPIKLKHLTTRLQQLLAANSQSQLSATN